MKTISFIIPLHNMEGKIKNIFQTLSQVRIPRGKSIEKIIFIDNGSTDNTFQELLQYSQEYSKLSFSIISHKIELTPDQAIREGLKSSKARVKIILSPTLDNLDEELKKLKSNKKRGPRNPKLSVVMPVYNAEKFLDESINSVLKQTFKDFEFIIVDDASRDKSFEIIKKYARLSKRIKYLQNARNLKQAATVQKAMDMARGEYIARMDADDVALPTRFEKQIKYLEENKRTVAVGSQCLVIDSDGNLTGEKTFPKSFEDVYPYIFKFCPLQQPTVMIARKRLPNNFPYYNHGLSPVEDVEFLFKLFKYGRVENLPEYLLLYRIHDNNSSLKNFRKSFFLTLVSRIRGVLLHEYLPTPDGVLVTIAQSLVILLLPQKLSVALYQFVKNTRGNLSSSPFHKRVAYQFSSSI